LTAANAAPLKLANTRQKCLPPDGRTGGATCLERPARAEGATSHTLLGALHFWLTAAARAALRDGHLNALLFTVRVMADERDHLLTSCLMYNASRKKLGPLTAIDLFAGAGGLTLAAQRSGIEVRAAVELDSHACATYRKNLVDETTGYPNLIKGDINELDWAELLKKAGLKLRECSLLLGGPPCQGFSTHRIKHAGVDDPRNELLVRYFECVAAIKPKAFLVENVPGLLWDRHASYLQRFYSLATEAGYVVFEPVVLNSRDFGVPQIGREFSFWALGRTSTSIYVGRHRQPTTRQILRRLKRATIYLTD
jgi:hypothetical protein